MRLSATFCLLGSMVLSLPAAAAGSKTPAKPEAARTSERPVTLDVQWQLLEAPPSGGKAVSVKEGKNKLTVERGKETQVTRVSRMADGQEVSDVLFVTLGPSEIAAAVKVSFRFQELKGTTEVFSASPAMDLKFAAAGELEETLKSSKLVRTLKIRVSGEEVRSKK